MSSEDEAMAMIIPKLRDNGDNGDKHLRAAYVQRDWHAVLKHAEKLSRSLNDLYFKVSST